MSSETKLRDTSLRRAALASALWAMLSPEVFGGVTSSTNQHAFAVEGTTASSVVRFMNEHALAGDHGHAYASIHPDYRLSMTTRESGRMCRAAQVDVHVEFDLTLPVAAEVSSMSGSTRRAWNHFAVFAQSHENHHKASYLGCASAFVEQAKRHAAPSCNQVNMDVRQMLDQMKRNCEVKQRPFDQSQARILRNLSLFAFAR